MNRHDADSGIDQHTAAEIRAAAESLRDACFAVQRDGGRSFALLKAMDTAEERLNDLLDAETVLGLLDQIEASCV